MRSLLPPSQRGCEALAVLARIRGPLGTSPMTGHSSPPWGQAFLTDGIRGAMVVGRIWGCSCSSFWICKNSSGQSEDTHLCAVSGGHPSQTNMTPGSAHAELALPC